MPAIRGSLRLNPGLPIRCTERRRQAWARLCIWHLNCIYPRPNQHQKCQHRQQQEEQQVRQEQQEQLEQQPEQEEQQQQEQQ